MTIEARRACGYRRVGGLYLVGGGLGVVCDRLPLPIIPCDVCGEEPRFHRGISHINPMRLWDDHSLSPEGPLCLDITRMAKHGTPTGDPICSTPTSAYLMWVGTEYTPDSFITEARKLGVSKRIPHLPDGFSVGTDWVFLAYLHLIPPIGAQLPLESDQDSHRGYKPGVFYAFRPERVEKIITRTQAAEEEVENLEAVGITAVVVPDEDTDHNPKRKRKQEPGE